MGPSGFARWAGVGPVLLAVAAGVTGAAAVHVHIQNNMFSPVQVLGALGDVVTWDNHDNVLHSATDANCPRANGPGPCLFDSGDLNNGGTYSHTFNAAGAFDYICTVHNFAGAVVVNGGPLDPDLVVAALAIQDLPVADGLPFTHAKRIDATVENRGATAAGPSVLRLSYLYHGRLVLIADLPLAPLAPAAAASASTVWDPAAKVGDFTVRAMADGTFAVTESREDNNVRTLRTSVLLPPGTLSGFDPQRPL